MIEFIEKEKYHDDDPFVGCDMYPTYMVKDGKEYFMFNRRDPDDKWKLEENEQRKKRLIETNGKYFSFHGFYSDPLEMLIDVANRKHHFSQPDILYYGSLDKEYLDFLGNLKEVSAAFHYRIYDRRLGEKIQKVVEFLNQEDWDTALRVINQMEE